MSICHPRPVSVCTLRVTNCCNVSARSARLTIDNRHWTTNVHHWQAPAAEDVAEAEAPAKEQAADGMSLGWPWVSWVHKCQGFGYSAKESML